METEIFEYKVKIELKTGLHIGGAKEEEGIGGVDNIIIKTNYKYNNNQNIKVPIIPGSSLKGKLRSLIEKRNGYVYNSSGEVFIGPCKDKKDKEHCEAFLRLFGTPPIPKKIKKDNVEGLAIGRGRLIFEDLYPKKEFIEKWISGELELIEIKAENVIDREKGNAKHPRISERVVPGVIFEGKLILTLFDKEDKDLKEKMEKIITEEFKQVLEKDYLGGSGTRGYGRVKIEIVRENNKEEVGE